MRRLIFPLVLGLGGLAILLSLGVWQVQRLTWKEAVLARIEARIGDEPVPLPAGPDPVADQYLAVRVAGRLTDAEIHVLISTRDFGAGYRDITAMETTDGRRILVDRGFIELNAKNEGRAVAETVVTGNLLWPDEVDGWTPPPDTQAGIWFARDLPAMAAALGTEPVLVVARAEQVSTAGVTPLPIDIAGIPNDHLNYAITWFLLALVWAVMSGLLIVRTRARKD